MDAEIADTINRRDVALITARLDALDLPQYGGEPGQPAWYDGLIGRVMLSDDPRLRPDKAWLIGRIARGIPGIAFDGCPADCDWDNLFQHFRNAISARRDPKTPPGGAAENQRAGVV